MRRETLKLLQDIADAAADLGRFCEDKTFDDYSADVYFQAAAERKLEIIGEAVRRLRDVDPETCELLPEYQRIIGLRNLLAHGYDVVRNDVLWDILQNRVPELLAKVHELRGS